MFSTLNKDIISSTHFVPVALTPNKFWLLQFYFLFQFLVLDNRVETLDRLQIPINIAFICVAGLSTVKQSFHLISPEKLSTYDPCFQPHFFNIEIFVFPSIIYREITVLLDSFPLISFSSIKQKPLVSSAFSPEKLCLVLVLKHNNRNNTNNTLNNVI